MFHIKDWLNYKKRRAYWNKRMPSLQSKERNKKESLNKKLISCNIK